MAPAFDLWLEFEHTRPRPGDDPANDFANVQVWLPDGRRYALNVWAFEFLRRARFSGPYQEGVGEPAEYLLTPDPFAAIYPNVADWVQDGWIEVGRDDYSKSFVRVPDIGRLVWKGDRKYPSVHEAMLAADAAWFDENGYR